MMQRRVTVREAVRRWLWEALTPRPLREAITSLSAQLLLDEQGWIALGAQGDVGVEQNPILRKDAVLASRYYWQRDSLYGNAIRLIKNYTFGRGIGYRANDPDVQAVLDAFWDDEDNSLVATPAGQWELAERIQTDGELPFVYFVDRYTGRVKTALIDTLEITQVITHPQNNRKPLYYERRWNPRVWSWSGKSYRIAGQRVDYYPDWQAATKSSAPRGLVECPYCGSPNAGLTCLSCIAPLRESHAAIGSDPTGETYSTVSTPHTQTYMHMWKVNSRSERGLPSHYSGLTWTKTSKGFMQDRATLTLASATFAFKQIIKGGVKQIARMVDQWGSAILGRYGGTRGRERREGAQIMIENESATLEQFNFTTRSSEAYQDWRMFRQMIGASAGIIEQDLTGDPTIGNLASMTAMAGTQLKNFESWQEYFTGIYEAIFDFVIQMAIKYGKLTPFDKKTGKPRDLTVEVNFPPILGRDLSSLIGAVSQLISAQTQAQREYISPRRIAGYILQAFGETDVDQALKELNLDGEGGLEPLPDDVADLVNEAIQALIEVGGNGREPALATAE